MVAEETDGFVRRSGAIGAPTLPARVGRNDRRIWDLHAAVRRDAVDRDDSRKGPAASLPTKAALAQTGVSRPSHCLNDEASLRAPMWKTQSQSLLCDKQVISDGSLSICVA